MILKHFFGSIKQPEISCLLNTVEEYFQVFPHPDLHIISKFMQTSVASDVLEMH